jgi:hypothetical protein
MSKYKERLYQEWKQHGKIIIGVDFDDTISPWKFKDKQDLEELDRTIQILRVAHETGAYIVIFTACNPDRYMEIQDYCDKVHLPIDTINRTPFDLPYGKNGKIYANIFLDDRAGLTEALGMLESVMYKIRGEQASNLTLGEHV